MIFGRRGAATPELLDPMHWLRLGRLVEAAELASIVLTTRQDVPPEYAAIGRTLGRLSAQFSDSEGFAVEREGWFKTDAIRSTMTSEETV